MGLTLLRFRTIEEGRFRSIGTRVHVLSERGLTVARSQSCHEQAKVREDWGEEAEYSDQRVGRGIPWFVRSLFLRRPQEGSGKVHLANEYSSSRAQQRNSQSTSTTFANLDSRKLQITISCENCFRRCSRIRERLKMGRTIGCCSITAKVGKLLPLVIFSSFFS